MEKKLQNLQTIQEFSLKSMKEFLCCSSEYLLWIRTFLQIYKRYLPLEFITTKLSEGA